MKKYVKDSSAFNFNKHYSVNATKTDNLYQVILSGDVADNSVRLRIGRATSTGRKIYAYAIVGQLKPGRIEVWYEGICKLREDFGLYDSSLYNSEDEYLFELMQASVDALDEVNESLE